MTPHARAAIRRALMPAMLAAPFVFVLILGALSL